MADATKTNVCVQLDTELVNKLDSRIARLCKSGQETDRSKFIRSLLRRELNDDTQRR